MISLKNSLLLASTKLKTHKIRLFVSILTSSMMFGVMLLGVTIYQGAIVDTLNNFSETGLSGRSILKADKSGDAGFVEIKVDSKQYKTMEQILDQKASEAEKVAKEIKLPFDKESYKKQINPFDRDDARKMDKTFYFDSSDSNIVIQEFFKQNEAKDQLNDQQYLDILQKSASQNSGEVYIGYKLSNAEGESIAFDQKTSKYNYEPKLQNRSDRKNEAVSKSSNGLSLNEFDVLPETLNKAFLIKHSWDPNNKAIPVMLPLNSVEKLLSIEPLSNKTKESLINHNKMVVDKAVGLRFKQCYYNQSASKQLEQALAYRLAKQEDDKHKGEADYQRQADGFEVVYELPASSGCSLPKLVKDDRTSEAKDLQAKQAEFERRLSGEAKEKAKATELEFELVGILPISRSGMDQNYGLVDAILEMIISRPDVRALIPTQLFDQLPNKAQVISQLNADQTKDAYARRINFQQTIDKQMVIQRVFAELPNGKVASQFETKHNCFRANLMNFDFDPKNCSLEQSFEFRSFANNQMQLHKVNQIVWKTIQIGGAIISGIAVIIMFGVISRMLSDNRKETAVFRAIGFKRADISAIYVSYTLLVCLFITVVATGLALVVALVINHFYQQSFTTQALYMFNSNNFDLKASFVGWNWTFAGLVYGLIGLAGLISLIIPLLLSIRRNPINDMRSE